MKYKQSTGQIYDQKGNLLGTGWAGNGAGKNNPSMQDVHSVGPIPQGWYIIGEPYDSPHTGQFTLPLTPYQDNEMFGRDSFKIHGSAPNVDKDGFITGTKNPVSEGCIIQPRDVREKINNLRLALDNELEVVV